MQTLHPPLENTGPDPADDGGVFDDLLDIGDRRRVFVRLVFGVEVDQAAIDSIFADRIDGG